MTPIELVLLGLIPEELQKSIETQLDAIANLPEKDFHPGSNNMVQDLIHPSLYPYIQGDQYIYTSAII
jgi:hypothetical protein